MQMQSSCDDDGIPHDIRRIVLCREIERIRAMNRKNNLIIVRENKEEAPEEEPKPYVPEAFACNSLEEWLQKRKEMEAEKAALELKEKEEDENEQAVKKEEDAGKVGNGELTAWIDFNEDSDGDGMESCSSDIVSCDGSDSGDDSSSDGSENELERAKVQQQAKLKEFFKNKYKDILKEVEATLLLLPSIFEQLLVP